MPFSLAHLSLAKALAEREFTSLTQVQTEVVKVAAQKRDLLVSAQTGSGKTIAYGLAAANILLEDKETFNSSKYPIALIIAPTRELAMQVHSELSWLYQATHARIVTCIGGMDARREIRNLQQGCHFVVGTPGRLCDHLRHSHLNLSQIKLVTLDEADEMLDLGFRDELETILDATPKIRTTFLFSATIANNIIALARKYQQNAIRINASPNNTQHQDIDYIAYVAAAHNGEHVLINSLRYFDSPSTLVFCATREMVRHTHGFLLERGFTSVSLSGDLSQSERSRAIDSMRDGHVRICVATDVAARGLDLPDLRLVIHASLPGSPEILLHRSGRTGRAGKKGHCVIIVPIQQKRRAEHLLSSAHVAARWEAAPSFDDVREKDAQRLLAFPLLAQDTVLPDMGELVSKLTATHTPTQIATALVGLYHANLPEPEELIPVSHQTFFGPNNSRKSTQSRTSNPPKNKPNTGTWYSIAIGRKNDVDMKQLIPLICRLGGIKKHDIGNIRIENNQSLFEISANSLPYFQKSLAKAKVNEVEIRLINPPSMQKANKPHTKKHKSYEKGNKYKKELFLDKPSSRKRRPVMP